MATKRKGSSSRRREPVLRLELTEPKFVPMTPEQRREIVQILSSIMIDQLYQRRARARHALEDAG